MTETTTAATEGLKSEFLYDVTATIGASADLGQTPRGHRQIIAITGGRVEGPRLTGVIEPVGADWLVTRPDGVIELDVRFHIRSADGALIYCRYMGYIRGEAGVLQRVFAGEDVNPAEYYMRAAPLFETGDPRYAWLNSVIAVGVGRVDFRNGAVHYRV